MIQDAYITGWNAKIARFKLGSAAIGVGQFPMKSINAGPTPAPGAAAGSSGNPVHAMSAPIAPNAKPIL